MIRRDFDPDTVMPDGRPPAKGMVFDPKAEGAWRGSLHGEVINGPVTVLAYGNDTPGQGPKLHVHPYDETFIVIAGRARFFVGDDVIEAGAGEAVLGPAGIPHRFENLGPGRLQTIDIHHSPRWIQTDLD
ncbi:MULTISPECIES: cupin domain-containing protein [Rhizobiaceae]|jgi:mannose-6-phosphate isomerase-like protein (cupin superfamily)|uniref:Mannose-6-phosphate isomerase-like protein (Cupin superfamily) n=1 Tax=Aliirhizobium cellulosilyticum TaxID=393664 RepID=A0A7W6UX21_9HYPH|nr:cupin domain-containing protein [Rhizobium cellulosilyticum]MBB4347525.1 mannose-6-phosphate isomerase-like protein (cupin superfamily) [Rhizobium cellulosilyticum]MBB4410080.1 mannose-6-phosphate isomerase-like protein (cupin superfamily) [Rhizobium cellulosilyticum]MBB4444767.1 mannose-6-phosphate isomerase-like protein (cupin superfamily) [Rhizobium cellulosilyticum]